MEEAYGNGSYAAEDEGCSMEGHYLVSLALINIFTFVIGQPVIAKLLWITFTANKSIDVLNCNLALFHNFQYLVCLLHLIFLFIHRQHQVELLQTLLIYGQVGGPLSLCFICLERYVAVIYPISYRLLKKYRCREVCAAMVWLCSLLAAMMAALAVDSLSSLTEKVIKSLPLAVMIVATQLMAWSSVRIARVLRKSSPGRDQAHPVKRKAFRTVCATTAINLLSYIPVSAMQSFRIYDKYLFNCVVTPISILLLSVASVVHPLFYLSTKEKLFVCVRRKPAEGS